MNTPIQQAIEQLEKMRSEYTSPYHYGLDISILELKKMLSLEHEFAKELFYSKAEEHKDLDIYFGSNEKRYEFVDTTTTIKGA